MWWAGKGHKLRYAVPCCDLAEFRRWWQPVVLAPTGGLPRRTISLPASEGSGYLCRHSKQIHKRRLQTVVI